jgi:hypothetical protein
VLLPPANLSTKGRKPDTKRLAITLELYEEEKRRSKKMKLQKAEEKGREKIEKLEYKKSKLELEKKWLMCYYLKRPWHTAVECRSR